MEIRAGQIIVNPRETIFMVDQINGKFLYCTILSSVVRKSQYTPDEVRPYFLQIDQTIRLDMGIYYDSFVIKNVYYETGKIVVNCRHVGNIDMETDFEEKEIIKRLIGYGF